ncbi:MAG: dTDP-glucose 4,6-dehydratase [Verrucomicrobia bacterium]|nr:dTDP-glucose 4,6-dehydratase [Verrucomicrobiota bacterium]
MKLLVTGGCGFIGSHFVRLALARHRDIRLVNVDRLTYAGRGRNLADIERDSRYCFLKADVASSAMFQILHRHRPDAVVNFAAESHVDRSIHCAADFLKTNTLGVQNLLDAARAAGVRRFVQISTDEVYGSISGSGRARENAPLLPSSPYSASKAAADLCCLAAHRTHGQDAVITRCTNNYGPYQFPEKMIPLMITNALHDIPLPVYGDGQQRRDWIHVEDHCRGIFLALEKGTAGGIYNFGMGSEPPNLMIVLEILKILGKSETLIRHVKDRPGHDRRYAVDTTKARKELGWTPLMNFERGLAATVEWYRENTAWWLRLKDAAFRKFYRQNYGRPS